MQKTQNRDELKYNTLGAWFDFDKKLEKMGKCFWNALIIEKFLPFGCLVFRWQRSIDPVDNGAILPDVLALDVGAWR